MVRLVVLVAALLATAVACGNGEAAQPTSAPVDFWDTAPQNDQQYWEVYKRARAIEPCALIPRAELAKLGTVRSVVVTGPESCAAQLDSVKLGGSVRAQWRALAGTVEENGRVGTTKRIEDTTATVVADKDTRADKQIPAGERACTVSAKFPAHAGVSLAVTVPGGVEPCPVAETLTRTAVLAWKQQLRQDDPYPTVHTVLNGADPCAVTAHLGVTVKPDRQQLYVCALPYGGTEYAVLYEYQAQRAIENGIPIQIGDRTVFRHESNGAVYFEAQVGPPFADGEDGPQVPAVWVGGKDEQSLGQIMYQLLGMFP
ncbi:MULTISPECIES: hypothetical protein [unclassified Nocardia]|uniref:hypothetical protein n=1 Tax=unclassified Nocardia TaxID=2637762 RepID=UPI001CE47570|nr:MULTISPECIES: hypothetical protein [unclassified Nocardia]